MMNPPVDAKSQKANGDVFRNVLCPYYNTCLDHAVDKNLPKWDCLTCEHKNTKEPIDPAEAERCGTLLQRIFSEAEHNRVPHNENMTRIELFSAVTAKKWLSMIAERSSQNSF